MKYLTYDRPARLPLVSAVLLLLLLALSACGGTASADSILDAELDLAVNDMQNQVSNLTLGTPVPFLIVDQDALADLYDEIVPSVVNIQVTGVSPFGGMELPEGFPFDLPGLPGGPDMPLSGEGSGFIFDDEGRIVTNNHVVEGAEEVLVVFHDGSWVEAEVIATDPQSDLAVLQVEIPEGTDAQPLTLAQAANLRVGYNVIAIGNPFGLESTLTTGIVSALGRSFPIDNGSGASYTLPAVIQTDAAINPGNSGGPLLNLAGEVVGVNFAIESPVGANSGVGFAIPVSIVERIIPALISVGGYDYPYLGIAGQSITPLFARALELPNNVLGAYVDTVVADGPAGSAGVQAGEEMVDVDGLELRSGGDIITAIDDAPVRSFEDLVAYLVTKTEPGQEISLTVLRGDETLEIDVELGERPEIPVPVAQEEAGGVSAREALSIAREYASEEELLEGDIAESVVVQDELDDAAIWVVELSDDEQTITITIDAATGEVLDASVE